MGMKIPIFIGSNNRDDKRAVAVLKHSIEAHTSAAVDIRVMEGDGRGSTGFSHQRWQVPDLMGDEGYAIYLDSDILVLGDIQELYDHRQEGYWVSSVTYPRGSSAVSVIDCSVRKRMPVGNRKPLVYDRLMVEAKIMFPIIPIEWNCRNATAPGCKLIHYTKSVLQPWKIIGDREVDRIWYDYEESMK